MISWLDPNHIASFAGHTHGPCGAPLRFEAFSWEPADHHSEPMPADAQAHTRATITVRSAEELRGVLATRRAIRDGPLSIRLASGVYRLNETLVLTSAHSNTTISPASEDGSVVITGSRALTDLSWAPAAGMPKGIWVARVPADVETVDALRVNGLRATRARFPNANPECVFCCDLLT